MRYLGPIILLFLMIALVAAGLREYLMMRSPWDAKIAQAQSIMYYEVSGEKALKMKIYETDRSIRLMSHISLKSAGYEYDPEIRYTYCLEAVVKDAQDTELWRHEYWIETRQSKSDFSNGMWGMECAFTTTGLEVTDDRLTFIIFPENVPRGESMLELSLKGYEDGKALLRAYRAVERNGIEVARAELTLADDDKLKMAERAFHSDWRELTRLERQLMLKNEWQRVPPVGVSGVDYHTRQLYFTGFHMPGEMQPLEEGQYLAPGAGIALNLKGPVDLKLYGKISQRLPTFEEQKFRLPLPDAPVGPEDIELSLQIVKTPSLVENRKITVSAYGGFFREFTDFSLAAGEMASLSLVNLSAQPLRVLPLLSKGDEKSVLGQYRLEPASISRMKAIVPEARYYNAYRIKPGNESLQFNLFGEKSSGGGQTLRIVAYPVMGCNDVASEYEIKAAIRSSDGATVFDGGFKLDAVVSPFEDYPAIDPAQTRCPGDAQTAYLRFPDGEYTLELSSEKEIDVIVQTAACLYCEEQKHSSIQTEIEPLRWRNEIMELSRWFSLSANEEEKLSVEGRRTVIRARMRMEPPEEVPVDPGQAFMTLEAEGTVPASKLLEQVRESTELIGPWTYGAYTAVSAEAEYFINVPRDYLGRPAIIHCELSGEIQGRQIKVEIDGKPVLTQNLRMLSTDIILPLSPDRHSLILHGGQKDDRFWINLPVEKAQLSRHFFERTVYRLEPGTSMSFSVEHSAGIKQSLNVLAYGTGSSYGGVIRASFDGSSPRLRQPAVSSGITQAYKEQRLITPGASESLLSVDRNASVLQPTAMVMTLFEDASGGTHKLSLSVAGASAPVWVRVFAIEEAPRPGKGFMIWKSSKR